MLLDRYVLVRWRSLMYFLLADFEFHELLGLQLDLLSFSIGEIVFFLNFFECFILFQQHLVVLFQCILVHDFQHVLILFILVLKIGHARLVRRGEQTNFLLVGRLQLLLHFLEGLHIKFTFI